MTAKGRVCVCVCVGGGVDKANVVSFFSLSIFSSSKSKILFCDFFFPPKSLKPLSPAYPRRVGKILLLVFRTSLSISLFFLGWKAVRYTSCNTSKSLDLRKASKPTSVQSLPLRHLRPLTKSRGVSHSLGFWAAARDLRSTWPRTCAHTRKHLLNWAT